jgi:hypothetical protein
VTSEPNHDTIRDRRGTEIDRFQEVERTKIGKSLIRYLRLSESQIPQRPKTCQPGHTRIRDPALPEPKLFKTLKSTEPLDGCVTNAGRAQIEPF